MECASSETKKDGDIAATAVAYMKPVKTVSLPDNKHDEPKDSTLLASNEELWAKTEAQVEQIAVDIKESQALCSDKLPLSTLLRQYPPGSNFVKGLEYLQKHYSCVRTVRGDGNCFYRCFLYALCELVREKKSDEEVNRIVHFVESSDKLVTQKGGYDEFVIDLFYETLVALLHQCRDVFSENELHEALTVEKEGDTTIDCCIWYLRVLTATHLKTDPVRFIPFLEGDFTDIDSFCRAEIEPTGRECGMLQVLALAEVFGIAVNIEYLDGHSLTGELTKHEFGPATSKSSSFSFLYRPGHYDVLYKSYRKCYARGGATESLDFVQ